MTLFLDTSALLKRYVDEVGSAQVLAAMAVDPVWVASAVAATETELALCQLLTGEEPRAQALARFRADWDRFLVVAVDPECLRRAVEIGCQQRLGTLDAIHLAAVDRLPGPVTVPTFDRRQGTAANAMGAHVPIGDHVDVLSWT